MALPVLWIVASFVGSEWVGYRLFRLFRLLVTDSGSAGCPVYSANAGGVMLTSVEHRILCALRTFSRDGKAVSSKGLHPLISDIPSRSLVRRLVSLQKRGYVDRHLPLAYSERNRGFWRLTAFGESTLKGLNEDVDYGQN